MKNLIVGTAGHVDHGKTCLIKALTGIDTDRLKEEKKRGITIENGFADLIYGDYHIGIIDVPGHENFIKNMLIGIGGIDIVLLVVGLDEGVMPQTVEHFNILKMLQIQKGVIVYTKRDMVDDEDWIELVKDDTREMVKGSFLENAPEIEVSALTGLNIDELKELIISCIDDKKLKNNEADLFRLPVDRVFTIAGFGTVVTGTLVEGTIKVGDEVQIYPGELVSKVRNIQVHNSQVNEAYAGQRTAINLGGIKKEDIDRGSVLSKKGMLEISSMLDVELDIFEDINRSIINNSRVHFYCGSTEALAKVVLLDCDVAEHGDMCLAQLRLEEPVAVKYGDRFIVRFYSPLETVGGGKILESNPSKHKRFAENVIRQLKMKNSGSNADLCEAIIFEKSANVMSTVELMHKTGIPASELSQILTDLQDANRIKITEDKKLIHRDFLDKSFETCQNILKSYHKENSMSQGLLKEELKSRMEKELHAQNKKLVDVILAEMQNNGLIKSNQNIVALSDFEVSYSPEMEKLRQRILEKYRAKFYEMPTIDEILVEESDKINAKHIIESMDGNELTRLNFQYYIYTEALEKALAMVKEHIEANNQITLAEFRDMLGTSRKYAMTILEYFDEKKITQKIDDARILV